MITAIAPLIILSLFAVMIGLSIRQKALAHQDHYRDQAGSSELALHGPRRTKPHLQAASTRLRNTALARRKVNQARATENRVFTNV